MSTNKSQAKMLYACSKCFTRHPFEELSQGQQLCKKCRGDFPVVKCTYCRSEFQQESKSKTSSICKRCEQNVAQYGKPTSCQFCQLRAAYVGGKCQRCSSYYKRFGPPKTCEQCKQKSAFDKGDNSKLMCWACSCSYKRALAKTKQSDPARHSRVFKKEKRPEEADRHKKREKYMNSKKPNRPDVTKTEPELTHNNSAKSLPKRERDENTDHVGEITQLKEKIVFLEKTIKQKDTITIRKDMEITQMKANLFNDENIIREKMKQMTKKHDGKVTELTGKIRSLQNEIARLNKESRPAKGNKKMDNLFKDTNKRKISSRTASPVAAQARSRSRSPDDPAPVRSRSRSPATRNNSASPSPAGSVRSSPSRSPSPSAKEAGSAGPSRSSSPPAKIAKLDSASPLPEETNGKEEETALAQEEVMEEGTPRNSRSPSPEPTQTEEPAEEVAAASGSNSPASSP